MPPERKDEAANDREFGEWQQELARPNYRPWTRQLHALTEDQHRELFNQHGASIRTAIRGLATTAAALAGGVGTLWLGPLSLLAAAGTGAAAFAAWPAISASIGLDAM
jgi:hypothetical protein